MLRNPVTNQPPTPSPWRHLPNALTGLRMLLVVPLAWLIQAARYDAALMIAAIAGLTDALDGF
ncbi:MAG TPA: CDP-alcohol phosphatidyltransferase family protein, partial [Rudaea sp.]|nr:CDP-alcohol phosphatidyltransferase family protein [Rudaea sp.]